MSGVLVVFRLMPRDVQVNLDSLEQEIRSLVSPEKIERRPIGFGIVALHVFKFVEDSEGELERIEKKLKGLKSVGEVEVVEITRTI